MQVYDLNKLNPGEIERLIYQKEGKTDVTLYKREDGKFLIQNCPIGMQRQLYLLGAGAAGIALLSGVVALFGLSASLTPKPLPAEPNEFATTSRGRQGTTKLMRKSQVIIVHDKKPLQPADIVQSIHDRDEKEKKELEAAGTKIVIIQAAKHS